MNNLITAKTLLNSQVVTPGHKELGEIEDVAIHQETGRVNYLILKTSSFLGFDEKRFPIPFGAFYTDTNEENKIILDVDKERLEKAPVINFSEDEDFNYTEFILKVYAFYGIKPYLTDYSDEVKMDISNTGANTPTTLKSAGIKNNRFDSTRNRAHNRHSTHVGLSVNS